MVINENVINNAVKESIDNFLISEGFWNGVYQIANVLSNGRWNSDHGYYPNYKQTNGYFNQLMQYNAISNWMKFHRGNIYKALHGDMTYINRNYRYGRSKYDMYDYEENAKEYISYNISQNNLRSYMRRTFRGWELTKDLAEYVKGLQSQANNPDEVMRRLNIGYFRKNYYTHNNEKVETPRYDYANDNTQQQQQQSQNTQQQPQNQSGQQQQNNRYYKGPLDNPKINNKY